MIIVDSHVHLYSCFQLDSFFDNAFKNFSEQAQKKSATGNFSGVLCLADTPFSIKYNDLLNESFNKKNFKTWKLSPTQEDHSLIAHSSDNKSLIIIRSQQIVSKENLELLTIGGIKMISSGITLYELINMAYDSGSIPIIPWGFGKWTGNRGRIMSSLLNSQVNDTLIIGDNSGRTKILPYPRHFSMASAKKIKILQGSDPLPFRDEIKKPGSFGFMIDGCLEISQPFKSLKGKIYDAASTIENYGTNESIHSFIRNQIKMQIRKRFHKTI